jgi:hypothetical protein
MRFEVERARALMLSGAPLATRLPGRVGWELRMVVQGGLRILEAIERRLRRVPAPPATQTARLDRGRLARAADVKHP